MMLAAVKSIRRDEHPLLEGLYEGMAGAMPNAGLEPLTLAAATDNVDGDEEYSRTRISRGTETNLFSYHTVHLSTVHAI